MSDRERLIEVAAKAQGDLMQDDPRDYMNRASVVVDAILAEQETARAAAFTSMREQVATLPNERQVVTLVQGGLPDAFLPWYHAVLAIIDQARPRIVGER